jgi:hypothetical protein
VTGSGQPPISDRLRWDDDLLTARSHREFLRNPVRLSYAIGAVIMFVGALLPWAQGMVGLLPVSFGGFDGAGDGMILAGFAIVALLFARSPDFMNARRWAPFLLGLICVGIWLLGWQAGQLRIRVWEDDDGHGSMVVGYWIAGLGVIIVAVAGAYATLRHHEGQTSDPLGFLRMPRRSDAVTLGAWIGGLGGAWLGVSIALAIVPPVAVSAPMLFMGAIGLIGGAYLGRAVGRFVRG